jgi:hypothetical protein
MGYGSVTLLLLFFVSFGLWFAGYTSAAGAVFTGLYAGQGVGTVAGALAMVTLFMAAILIVIVPVIIGAALSSSFSVMFTIPIAIISIVIGILFLPLSFINESGLPWELKALLSGFFGILILITALDYIRGSGGGF